MKQLRCLIATILGRAPDIREPLHDDDAGSNLYPLVKVNDILVA